jgi:hypothetical protein
VTARRVTAVPASSSRRDEHQSPGKAPPPVREPVRGWPLWLRRDVGNGALVAAAPAPADELPIPPDAVREDEVPDPADTHRADDEPLHPAAAPGPANPTRAEGFVDGGQVGTVAAGTPVDLGPRPVARAFVNGGMTGTVAWAGGGGAGAHANEALGTLQTEVAPVFVPSVGTAPGKFSSIVFGGTGRVDVTRSYVGITLGDQGNGWFVTAAAAARINLHETLHVASARGFYTASIDPLLARVKNAALGRDVGASPAAAVAAHKAAINWGPSVTAFKTAELAANRPMGPVDTADLGSGTYPVNAGPATVGGKAYTSVLKTPAEAMPAP